MEAVAAGGASACAAFEEMRGEGCGEACEEPEGEEEEEDGGDASELEDELVDAFDRAGLEADELDGVAGEFGGPGDAGGFGGIGACEFGEVAVEGGAGPAAHILGGEERAVDEVAQDEGVAGVGKGLGGVEDGASDGAVCGGGVEEGAEVAVGEGGGGGGGPDGLRVAGDIGPRGLEAKHDDGKHRGSCEEKWEAADEAARSLWRLMVTYAADGRAKGKAQSPGERDESRGSSEAIGCDEIDGTAKARVDPFIPPRVIHPPLPAAERGWDGCVEGVDVGECGGVVERNDALGPAPTADVPGFAGGIDEGDDEGHGVCE